MPDPAPVMAATRPVNSRMTLSAHDCRTGFGRGRLGGEES